MAEIKSGISDKLTVDYDFGCPHKPIRHAGNYYTAPRRRMEPRSRPFPRWPWDGHHRRRLRLRDKTIRVRRVLISVTVAAAVYGDMICYKRTSSVSSGTKTRPDADAFRLDQRGDLNICGIYTADPTEGTGGGPIASSMQCARSPALRRSARPSMTSTGATAMRVPGAARDR